MTAWGRLPLFVREAMQGTEPDASGLPPGVVEEDAPGPASEAERSLLALEDALSDVIELEATHVGVPPSMAAQAPSRLHELVLAPPLRYAPFFSRLAELFDLSEEATIAELVRLFKPRGVRLLGSPGIEKFVVRGGPSLQAAEALIVRCKPGVSFPMPRHTGAQRVLVLEGSYEDAAGSVQRVGEYREWREGPEQSFKAGMNGPCVLACVAFGRFNRWPLRALASLLGR